MADNYKQYKKAKKERNLAQDGQILGGSLALGGAGVLGGREYIKKLQKDVSKLLKPTKAQVEAAARAGGRIIDPSKVPEKLMKNSKAIGITAVAGGTTLAGYSTIRNQRAKRRLKELTEDDSKKK